MQVLYACMKKIMINMFLKKIVKQYINFYY